MRITKSVWICRISLGSSKSSWMEMIFLRDHITTSAQRRMPAAASRSPARSWLSASGSSFIVEQIFQENMTNAFSLYPYWALQLPLQSITAPPTGNLRVWFCQPLKNNCTESIHEGYLGWFSGGRYPCQRKLLFTPPWMCFVVLSSICKVFKVKVLIPVTFTHDSTCL